MVSRTLKSHAVIRSKSKRQRAGDTISDAVTSTSQHPSHCSLRFADVLPTALSQERRPSLRTEHSASLDVCFELYPSVLETEWPYHDLLNPVLNRNFYSVSALLAMQTAVIATGCCLSVSPSVTLQCFVKTNEHSLRYSASGRTIILVSEEVKYIRIFAGGSPPARTLNLSLAKIWPIISHNLETVQDRR